MYRPWIKACGESLVQILKNVKGFGGRGKLTDSMIDRLQNCYGIAIQSNQGDLVNMKKSIFAALFHCASSEKNNWHDHCPKGKDSWCKFQQDAVNATNTYIPGAGLPLTVVSHVKPVFLELSDESLLQKCLHGKTQNQNKLFNGVIWQRIPKDVRVNKVTFELGVYDAVSHFNNGYIATLKTYKEIGLNSGYYITLACNAGNKTQIDNSTHKSSNVYQKRRRFLRGKRKSIGDQNKDKEVLCIKLLNFHE